MPVPRLRLSVLLRHLTAEKSLEKIHRIIFASPWGVRRFEILTTSSVLIFTPRFHSLRDVFERPRQPEHCTPDNRFAVGLYLQLAVPRTHRPDTIGNEGSNSDT